MEFLEHILRINGLSIYDIGSQTEHNIYNVVSHSLIKRGFYIKFIFAQQDDIEDFITNIEVVMMNYENETTYNFTIYYDKSLSPIQIFRILVDLKDIIESSENREVLVEVFNGLSISTSSDKKGSKLFISNEEDFVAAASGY